MAPPDVRPFLALALYIPVAIGVAASSSKEQSTRTIFYIFLGGVMFLPELVAFDAPLIPPLSKYEISGLMGLAGAGLLERRRLVASKPLRGVDIFFLVIVAGNVGTLMSNQDVLTYGDYGYYQGIVVREPKVLSGHRASDVLAFSVRDALSTYVPFLLGRSMFRTTKDSEIVFKGIVIIAIIYAPCCLLEARISPQIHKAVYGYMPTGAAGVVRGDGFKPVVFQNSGLSVATYLFCSVCSCAILLKRKIKVLGMSAAVPLVLIWITLALSHNMAALLYTLVAVPVLFVSRGRLGITTGVVFAVLVLVYPPVRATEAVDVYALVDWIAQYSPERADSLYVRFANEDILYERASDRVLFGWGGYGRNRVYNEKGLDISLTDGEWIMRVGARGIVGFIGMFGLLLTPLFLAQLRASKMSPTGRQSVDALAIILALMVVDLLPNSLFTKLPLFFGGILAGLSKGMVDEHRGVPTP